MKIQYRSGLQAVQRIFRHGDVPSAAEIQLSQCYQFMCDMCSWKLLQSLILLGAGTGRVGRAGRAGRAMAQPIF